MNDELIKDYSELEKKHREIALNEAKGYFKDRKPKVDFKKVQAIVFSLLRSYEYKIQIQRRKAELNGEDLEPFNERLSQIDKVLKVDFTKNEYVIGKLSFGFCEEFSLEDEETYSLFNEVYNYLERHSECNDADRLEILSKLSTIKSLVTTTRQNAVQIEMEFINKCLQTTETEFTNGKDLTNKDIFAVFKDFKHCVLNNKHNSNYVSELMIKHYPIYKDKVQGSFDGFGEYAKEKTSGLIEYKLMLNGNGDILKTQYDLVHIYDILQRKQETSEILSLVERARIALNEKNLTNTNGDSRAILNYNRPIIVSEDLEKYCQILIDKYDRLLKDLRYFELEEELEGLESTDTPNDKSSNNKMMDELGISKELLKLAVDDLCLFGFLETNNVKKLNQEQITEAITHAIKLKDLSYLSDDDKTVVRATWARMENGKRVVRECPTLEDIETQRQLDESKSIISRINTYAKDIK